MQAADTLESEEERMEGAEGNGSDEETDSECEEEEGATQSDSGVTADGHRKVCGRKRLSSEITDQLSPDAKCRHASNLHNERERERRKDLKQAVHRLRNQLQLRKTKKATTISVLKASEQEIKALKEMESTQNTDLENLKKHNNHLTWKLERLIGEYNTGSKTEQPPIPPLMPTILPFIPSSVPAAHPSISMAGPPHPVLLPSQMTTTSQNSFPFGTPNTSPFATFPYSLLPPAPPLTLASHPHPFPPHPSPAPFLIVSPPPPPQPIPFSTLMTRLSPSGPTAPTIPSRFPFPGSSFSPSHIPSSFATVMPSITVSAPPPIMHMPVLQYKNELDGYNATGAALSRKGGPPHLINVSEECSAFGRQRERVSIHREESVKIAEASACRISEGNDCASKNPREEGFRASSFQADAFQPMGKVVSESGEHAEGSTEQFIDVESTDQEEEEVGHQGTDESTSSRIRHQHTPHMASKQERNGKTHVDPLSNEYSTTIPSKVIRGPKNVHSPPALVKKAGVSESNTVSQIIQRVQPATDNLTQEALTSALKKHQQILLKHTERGRDNLHCWNNHTQEVKNTPLPQPPQRTPVICS